MSDEIPPEDVQEEKEVPMEVKIVNHPKPPADSIDDEQYDDLFIDDDEIKEFEKDGSQSKS